MAPKTPGQKGRLSGGRGFGSPATSGFGRFGTPTSGGSLSYLSDPPDFSSIPDPNIIVSFKNLLKKDNTTKSKALADLIQYTQAHPHELDGGVEDAILEAWVQLYPRISIDNDRRVRELAHTLQFELLKSARKRMEKNLPKIASPWLAGTFDRERAVARAASEGLTTFLNTEDKVTQLWKRCQPQILQYATDAITETPDTLSDERSTKPEDAEAKYYRVIAGSLSLVLGLLQRPSTADTDKYSYEFETFFAAGPGGSVWSFSTADDSRVRKAVYQLLQLCLKERATLLQAQMSRIGKVLTSEALKKPQLGSAMELVTVLTELTKKDKDLWGTKKSPLSKLRSFVHKGSHGSPPTFWQALDQLLTAIPSVAVTLEIASDFLRSLRAGISRREEPRTNAPHAWVCYLNTVYRLLNQVDGSSRTSLVMEHVFPLTDNYFFAAERQGEWLTGVDEAILSRAYRVVAASPDAAVSGALGKEWERLADVLAGRMANSLPEVSKDFDSSQRKLAADGKRWYTLVGTIHKALIASPKSSSGQPVPDCTKGPSWKLAESAADLLTRRNFKPFGAAAVLQNALKLTPYLFQTHSEFWTSLIPLRSEEELSRVLSSPSAEYITSCILALGQQNSVGYKDLWTASTQCLVRRGDIPHAAGALTRLISDTTSKPLAQEDSELQEYLEKNIRACSEGSEGSWDLFDAALIWDVLPESKLRVLASTVVDNLNSDQEASMKATEMFLKRKPLLFSDDETLHLNLVTKLLAMMEISDSSVAQRAVQLRTLLEKHADAQPSVLTIIQDNLNTAGSNSLGVETLLQQATAVSQTAGSLGQILPNAETWMKELSQFLQSDLSPSLALTSNIGGAYFLPHGNDRKSNNAAQRDQRGLSVPARMAMYTTGLLSNNADTGSLPLRQQAELLNLLYLVAELASDQITLMDDNQLFGSLDDADLLEDVESFVTSTRKIMKTILAEHTSWKPGEGGSLLDDLIGIMLEQASDLSPLGVYSARALSEILATFSDTHGHGSGVEAWLTQLDILKATPTNVLPAVAVLTGYGEVLARSKAVTNLLNRLISDVAGASPDSAKTVLTLVLLNACMPIFELGELPVANNRLVFAVKQITSWFEEAPKELGVAVATESCRALQRLLPCVGAVYGPYWEQTIVFCISSWSHAGQDEPEKRLPYIYTSVKLVSGLRTLEDANDDLVDALQSQAESIYRNFLELLKLSGSGTSQPEQIVDALLCREAAKIPLDYLHDLADLYGLVASESREIQTAGFGILQRALPAAQEKLSFDVLLEKKQARLPDELTSLLLDAPTLEAYPEELLVQFPTPIRSYLLSWKLVFVAYAGAAYKVRADYTEDLKMNNAANPLFEFMFDVLGHSAANPLHLDREGLTAHDIQNYDIKIADGLMEEKNMHWLLVHLFFLTLKYAPGLFKTWYLDCRSKQTRIAIEPWLMKYFSPIIIHDVISEVERWSKSQEVADPDEKDLIIKVHQAQREIIASYPIDDGGDEQQASILIRIKPNYPLDYVDVVGLHRVACNERTWQSWLRTTQGVILISNGAVIDGLTTFRRNVVGALKGHVECAICYSFIAVDRKMPDKKCQTCKNLFHRDCLFKWFSSANQNTCPLCRTRMDVADKKKVGTRMRRPDIDEDFWE